MISLHYASPSQAYNIVYTVCNIVEQSTPLQRFPTYVVLIHQRHRRTDRRTDGRHTIARWRDLHYSASRSKKSAPAYVREISCLTSFGLVTGRMATRRLRKSRSSASTAAMHRGTTDQ